MTVFICNHTNKYLFCKAEAQAEEQPDEVPDAAKVQRFVVCVSALTVLENRGCEVSLVLTGVSRAVLSVAGLWRTLRHSVVARFHPGVLSPLQTQNGDDAQPLCGSAPR